MAKTQSRWREHIPAGYVDAYAEFLMVAMEADVELKKGEHFIDRFNGEEWVMHGGRANVYASERAAAEALQKILDGDPGGIYRIRDQYGGNVWETPPPSTGESNDPD